MRCIWGNRAPERMGFRKLGLESRRALEVGWWEVVSKESRWTITPNPDWFASVMPQDNRCPAPASVSSGPSLSWAEWTFFTSMFLSIHLALIVTSGRTPGFLHIVCFLQPPPGSPASQPLPLGPLSASHEHILVHASLSTYLPVSQISSISYKFHLE